MVHRNSFLTDSRNADIQATFCGKCEPQTPSFLGQLKNFLIIALVCTVYIVPILLIWLNVTSSRQDERIIQKEKAEIRDAKYKQPASTVEEQELRRQIAELECERQMMREQYENAQECTQHHYRKEIGTLVREINQLDQQIVSGRGRDQSADGIREDVEILRVQLDAAHKKEGIMKQTSEKLRTNLKDVRKKEAAATQNANSLRTELIKAHEKETASNQHIQSLQADVNEARRSESEWSDSMLQSDEKKHHLILDLDAAVHEMVLLEQERDVARKRNLKLEEEVEALTEVVFAEPKSQNTKEPFGSDLPTEGDATQGVSAMDEDDKSSATRNPETVDAVHRKTTEVPKLVDNGSAASKPTQSIIVKLPQTATRTSNDPLATSSNKPATAPIFSLAEVPPSKEIAGDMPPSHSGALARLSELPSVSADAKPSFNFATIPSFADIMGGKQQENSTVTGESDLRAPKAPARTHENTRAMRSRNALAKKGMKASNPKKAMGSTTHASQNSVSSVPTFPPNGSVGHDKSTSSSKHPSAKSTFDSVPKSRFSGYFPTSDGESTSPK